MVVGGSWSTTIVRSLPQRGSLMSSSHEEVTDGVYTPDPPSVPIKIMPRLVKKRYKCVTNRDAMGSGAAFSGGKGGTADVHSGRKRRTSLRTQGFLHGRSGRQPVAMPSCATSTNTSFPKGKHPKSPSPPSCENSSSTSTHNSKSIPLNSRHVKTVAASDVLSRESSVRFSSAERQRKARRGCQR